jgi:hypothetical protein
LTHEGGRSIYKAVRQVKNKRKGEGGESFSQGRCWRHILCEKHIEKKLVMFQLKGEDWGNFFAAIPPATVEKAPTQKMRQIFEKCYNWLFLAFH